MTVEYTPYVRIPYSEEISQLPASYASAFEHDVTDFATWLREQEFRSLLAVGAGGSLPIAQMAVTLHQRATGRLSRAGEPLDIFLGTEMSDDVAGLLVTASGGHSDSLAACESLVSPKTPWAVFCGLEKSKGGESLKDSSTPVFGYNLLPELHGWVAVNALMGQAVVLARAYSQAFPEQLGDLPATLDVLFPTFEGLNATSSIDEWAEQLTEYVRSAVERRTLIFLHGPETKAGALDLDSKFAEAGLGHLVASEYRNFAHGRYQMMLPIAQEVGVVALNSAREDVVARASVAEIPAAMPAARIAASGVEHGLAAEQVSALLAVLVFVGSIGQVRDLQPGWGADNTFGDQLYELDLSTVFEIPPAHLRRN